MSYFVLRGASQRTKTLTSFALALLMIFQAFGPGVFALKTAHAEDDQHEEESVKKNEGDHEHDGDHEGDHEHDGDHDGDHEHDGDHDNDGDHEHDGDHDNDGDHEHEHDGDDDGDTPQEVTPCLVPVTVLPGDKITTFGASNGPEVTLQTVLDTQYPPANTVDDIGDETGIQAWNIPVGTNTVTVDAKLLSASAGNTNELGYYFDNDTSTFVSLFVVPGNTNPAIDTGSVAISTLGHTKIAFALKSGANTYASQYTLNAGNEDHAAVYEPVAGTYAIAFEDLPLSGADKDYNDLVAEIKIVGCNGGTQCVPGTGSVVSDTTVNNVTDGNIPAVALTFVHPAWTANIPGATWIWATNPVVAPTNDADLTKVFTKTFTITGTPTSGTLDIAVDNNYSVKVNGNVVPVVFDQNNFQLGTQDSYNVLPFLTTGLNTIEITATNQEIGQDADPAANPAGVLFELSWASNCDGGGSSDEDTSTITIHKYIDGQPATSELAGETTFNVETAESWAGELPGNSNGVRNLSVDNNYTYTSHPLVDENNTFIANEVIGGDIIGPEAECAPGKFKLAGYSFGPTLNDAFTSASTTAAHQFENISSNQHVIVWNDACPTTAHVTATKIVCTNEADLPNFGNGTGAPISATTATDWISEAHPSCSLQPDWTFQWAPSGTSNPGDNTGAAGSPWTSTGATIANGTISFDVPVVTNGGYVWMREIMKPGYIPFTGQNTTQDVSAEIYCGIDHLNFDNYDRIDNLVAGNNYNCVAWNVPIQGDGGPQETKTFATTTIFATDLAADIPAVILTPTKWFFYNDETDVIDNVLGSFVFGPNTAPLGNGSAQMSVTGTQRRNIATYQFSNVKLSNIKALRFSTYSESAGNGSPASERSAYLHFNVSFDGVDSWQKRLVYVPSVNGAVTNDSWQSWDAIDGGNGLWLYSGATWPAPNAIPGTTPKTWAQILTDYPNIQTRTTDSWMGLRVGEPYNDGFTGEVDNFVIAIKSGLNTHTETYDFEPTSRNEDCNDCGGGNNTPTETLIPTGGSGSRSGQQRGGSVAGASTNVPQVLGASTDVPSMPDTGNGASSKTLAIVLSIFGALVAVNAIAIRKMRNS